MSDSEQPDATESAPQATSLGQALQTARVAQDLTIEQIAAELRIEAKQLQALEDDRFADIGVPVFVKGYLKQYGQRLGLDVPDLLTAYYRQTDLSDVQIQPSRTIKLRNERQIASWFLAGIVLLGVVVGLAVWWWNGGNFDLGAWSASPAAAPRPSRADEVVPPTPVVEPAVEAPSPALPPAVAEAALNEAPAPVAADAEPQGAAVTLEFTFEGESWTEVTDASGQRLLFGLNSPGRQVSVRGEPPFDVLLGNANAVRLVVDGRNYSIPTRGRPGELARFSVDVAAEE